MQADNHYQVINNTYMVKKTNLVHGVAALHAQSVQDASAESMLQVSKQWR
jgi:hypothetical protein